MSGLWFVVGIPKKEHEKLEKNEQKKREEAEASVVAKNEVNKTRELNTKNNVVNSIIGNQKKWTVPQQANNAHPVNNDAPFVSVNLGSDEPLEDVLEEALQELGIYNAVWTTDKSNKHYQVYFPCEYGVKSDKVLTTLTAKGFGHIGNSSLGAIPFTVYYCEGDDSKKLVDNLAAEGGEADAIEEEPDDPTIMGKFKAAQQKFLNSVKARLTVAQVVQGIRSGADLTFDFVFYILSAAMIAAMGLMEDSSVSLIGAMLVSPMMGPVLAASFGFMIGDSSLRNLGLRNVCIGLSLCYIFGIIFGFICMNFTETWDSARSVDQWPTSEMLARGQPRNLWAGALVAIPSGIAVGLAVLAGSQSTLVGVAIAASLLPPTVNCGILMSFAILKNIWAAKEMPETRLIDGKNYTYPPSLLPPPDYKPLFHPNMSRECVVLGCISFCLTAVNILCIFLFALIVLKIKEVAPHTSVTKTQRFWKHDIRVAREYNRSLKKADGSTLAQDFLREWAILSGLDPQKVLSQEARMAQMQTIQDLVAEVENDEVYQSVVKSVAGGPPPDIFQHFDIPNEDTVGPSNTPRRMSLHSSVLGIVDNNPMPGGASRDQPSRERRQSRVMNWISGGRRQSQDLNPSATVHLEPISVDDSELKGIDGRRRSVLLKKTLTTSGHNPHSLWPSRFQVSPVDEEGPLPPSAAGRRRFTRVAPENRRISLPQTPRRFSFNPTDSSMSKL